MKKLARRHVLKGAKEDSPAHRSRDITHKVNEDRGDGPTRIRVQQRRKGVFDRNPAECDAKTDHRQENSECQPLTHELRLFYMVPGEPLRYHGLFCPWRSASVLCTTDAS